MEISHSSWPWHRSDATALAGYANMKMMMMIRHVCHRRDRQDEVFQFHLFCSCDLDLGSMALIYELDL